MRLSRHAAACRQILDEYRTLVEEFRVPDAKDYTPDDWRLCLSNVLDQEPTARDAALRFAAYWAASHMGLTFSRLREGGSILTGLDAALRGAIERGEMIDAGSGCVRKP